jgi:molybdopterin-guanine dinucleotide biosynthesis protein B
MIPIVSIVGQSQSGKTTLIERLIAEFKKRSYRVAAMKHASKDFDMDRPGKDTWRFAQAGSDAVVISAPQRLAMLKPQDNNDSIDEVMHLLDGNYDIVLVEGFHGGHAPKIEVHRKDLNKALRCRVEEIKAVVTDESLEIECPQFSWEEISAIADFIVERIIGKRGDETSLFINGSAVPLNRFTQQVFANALLGIASALKGVTKIRNLEVSVIKRRKS